MDKKILFSILGLFIISLVSAGLIGLSALNSKLTLNSTSVERIKQVADIQKIEVEIGKIQCDDVDCWATLYQEDLIQDEWRRGKSYCTKYKTINETSAGGLPDMEESSQVEACIEYTDYTLAENKQALQDYLEKRLDDWSIVEEERQNKVIVDKTDMGIIREKILEVRT